MTPPERIDERAKMLAQEWFCNPPDFPIELEGWRRLARLTFKLEMEAALEIEAALVNDCDARIIIRRTYVGLLPEE